MFLNELAWYARLPAKWAIFGLTSLLVCFPNPARLASHLDHWRDPNRLIEPDAPAIQPLVEELRPHMTADLSPRDALRYVERFVYEKIPSDWDWNTWGSADYLPTVTEAIEMGREDCDGRAVVAASLLSKFGFDAQIVTDFAHVWVKTDKGETMSPGKNKALVATKKGLQVNWAALSEIPRATAYGVAVFPAFRELIILTMLWFLLLQRRSGALPGAVGLAALAGGLFLIRAGGATYLDPTAWMQWLGAVTFIVGLAALLVWAPRNARAADRAVAHGAEA